MSCFFRPEYLGKLRWSEIAMEINGIWTRNILYIVIERSGIAQAQPNR